MDTPLSAKLTDKLYNTILQNTLINIDSINLWSESEIVLAWLTSHPSRWSQFVSNRVVHLQELFPDAKWRFKENPTKILSLGMLPSEIINCQIWWHGPLFWSTADFDLNSHNPK